MSLDPATVHRIARLARIHLEENEVARFQQQLNRILLWIEQLNELDVTDVAPLTGAAQMALKMREDAVADGNIPDEILANAPERAGNFFTVPKVVE